MSKLELEPFDPEINPDDEAVEDESIVEPSAWLEEEENVSEPASLTSPPLHSVSAFCTSILLLMPLKVQSGKSLATLSTTVTQSVAVHGALTYTGSVCVTYGEQADVLAAAAHTESA